MFAVATRRLQIHGQDARQVLARHDAAVLGKVADSYRSSCLWIVWSVDVGGDFCYRLTGKRMLAELIAVANNVVHI